MVPHVWRRNLWFLGMPVVPPLLMSVYPSVNLCRRLLYGKGKGP